MSLSPLDFIFPKRCVSCGKLGSYFCQTCFEKIQFVKNQVCPVCQRGSISGATHYRCSTKSSLDGQISAVYFQGPVKAAVHKLKYKWVFDITKDLVDLIISRVNFDKLLPQEEFFLVPIPLHTKREAQRGFNQAEKLAQILAEKLNLETTNSILVRIKNTKPQTELKAKDRRKNVIGAFKVVKPDSVYGKNFILVDDLVTTGSTLKSAAMALKKAGADKVWALTFAKTLLPKLN